MKIGLVTHYMPPHLGGVEIVANTLYKGYRAAGHEVRWLASRVPPDAPRRDGGLERVGCCNALERRLDVPMPLWGVAGALAARRLVRWADVIHAQDVLYFGTLFCAFWCADRRPLVISQHSPFIRYPAAWIRGVERAAFATVGRFTAARARALVAGTPGGRRLLEDVLGVPPGRLVSIPNGIDLDFFSPAAEGEKEELRRALGVPPAAAIVLSVGRLAPRKGARTVFQISELLPDLEFVQIGRGPLEGAIPRRAGNFRRIASVDTDTLRSWYRAADALLLLSHGEGLPLVVQEAQAVGLPAIVNQDEPFAQDMAARRLVIPVPSAPLPAAVAAVRSAMADRRTLRTVAQAGLENARRLFGVDHMVSDYLALFRELVR